MRILLISLSYRPSLNPRAFRWTAIAEQWARQGHHVDVICEAAPGHPATETINGVHLHRVGPPRLFGGRVTPTADASRQPAAGSRLKSLVRRLWRRLYWPDYACQWYGPARRAAAALLAGHGYDVMYSSSVPFTGHLVGLAAKAQHPGLRWVVDIGDPFSFADGAPVNNFALYAGLNRRVEERVFARADAVSVTTAGTAERYRALFPGAAAKINVIPPLLPTSFTLPVAAQPAAPQGQNEAAGKLRLVFVGTLYPDIRSPANLLACVARLLETALAPRLELHFFGTVGDCAALFEPYASLVDRHLFIHGLVPQADAAAAMQAASVLVNIGNNTAYQLPSKVIEYLAMMKPILNFVTSAHDSSAAFFQDFEGVLSVAGADAVDDPACLEAITQFLQHLPTIDPDRRRDQLQAFTADHIASAYHHLAGRRNGPS